MIKQEQDLDTGKFYWTDEYVESLEVAARAAKTALEKCRDGFEYTRQYVGYGTLPPIEGWSWYDGDCAAKESIDALAALIKEVGNE